MHKPSGLGIYAMGQWEQYQGKLSRPLGFGLIQTGCTIVHKSASALPLLPAYQHQMLQA